MLVISVDPGLVTGVSYFDSDMDFFDSAEKPAMDAVEWIHAIIRASSERQAAGLDFNAQLVCESYTVNANTIKHKRQYDALEVIGACRYLARFYGATFRLQPPPNRNLIKNEMLKTLGWYRPTKDKHQLDAAKHLAIACLRLNLLKPEDLGFGVSEE